MSVTEVFPPIPSNKSSAAVDGLKGNVLLSGLKITPSGLYFGAVVIGEDPLIQSVTIENQGRKALRIEEFFLEVGSDKFTLIGSAPDILKGGESFSVQVAYASNTIGTFNGLIVLRTSEKENNQYNIGLSGRVIGTTFLESMTEDFTAMVLEERWARTTADMAEAGHRLTLEASMNDGFTETYARIVQEQIARVTAIEAEASTREMLEASMTNQFFTANATIEAHRLARVNADAALAQSIEDLDAVFLNEGQVQTIANAAVHIESLARADADGALALRIETIEASYETAGQAYTDAKISDESTVRANADGALATRITTIEANYQDASDVDLKVNAKITEEATARANADGALATRATTLEAHFATGGTIDTRISAKVSEEATARTTADGALATRASSLEAKFATDGDVDTRIAAKVADEATARATAVGAVATRTSSLEARFAVNGDVDTRITAKVGAESTARANADGALATRIDTLEATAGYGVDTVARAAITDEATTRANADGALGTRISTIEAAYQTAGQVDTKVNAKVTEEATARSNADGAMSTRISTIESSYQTAGQVTTIANAKVADEASARASADGALSTRINNITADYTTSGQANALAVARVAEEATARANADGALATRATNLETRANGAEARLSVTESVATDAYGRSRAFLQQTAVAGDGRAQLTLYADSNGGGGVDIIGDVRIHGNLIVDGTIYNSKLPGEVIDYTKLATSSKGQTIIRQPALPTSPYWSPTADGTYVAVDTFTITFNYPVWVVYSYTMAYETTSGTGGDASVDARAYYQIYKDADVGGNYAFGNSVQFANTVPNGNMSCSGSCLMPAGNYTFRLMAAKMVANGRFLNGYTNISILWGAA